MAIFVLVLSVLFLGGGVIGLWLGNVYQVT